MAQSCEVVSALLLVYQKAVQAYRDSMAALVAGRTEGKGLQERIGLENQVEIARLTCEAAIDAIKEHRLLHGCWNSISTQGLGDYA